jgi:hypothetical protein
VEVARLIGTALRGRWSPLRISGTALPPAVLFAVKVMTLAFLLRSQVQALPAPFLSFVPALDNVHGSSSLGAVLQVVFVAASIAVLFNFWPRLSSLAMGLVVLAAILSSRMYLENNRLYTGAFFFIAGLYTDRYGLVLLRAQVILMYFGAALNKFLEADWRSGDFFVAFGQVSAYHHLYALIPSVIYPWIGWSVILTEAVICVGLICPALRSYAVWIAVGYHTTLLMVSGRTFGLFWFSLLASFVIFIDWPMRSRSLVSSASSPWGLVISLLRWLDVDERIRWVPTVEPRLSLEGGSVRRTGLAALIVVALNTPALYLLFVGLVAPLPEHLARYPAVLVLGALGLIAIDKVLRLVGPLLAPRKRVAQLTGSIG